MPGQSQVGGFDLPGALALVIILVVVFSPMLLCRRAAPPGRSDDEQDDGGGHGPRRSPPNEPGPPRGGIPLDDAQPARTRLRGHERLADHLPGRERRPAQPRRGPVRTSKWTSR